MRNRPPRYCTLVLFVIAAPHMCCAQQTGVHRMVGSNCLVYLPPEEKRAFICTFDLPRRLRPPCYLGPAWLNFRLLRAADRYAYISVAEAPLVYLPKGKRTSIYVPSTLPPGARPAEPVRTGE